MGRPIWFDSSSHTDLSSSASPSSSDVAGATAACNGASAVACPQYLFAYGNMRPDINPLANNDRVDALRASPPYQKAWLMGSRLFCVNRNGVECAALRLEEYGHAVRGCILSLHKGSAGILEECEAGEHPLSHYERDVVEVITESGQRVQAYVYHCQEVDRSNPVLTNDWLERR